MTSHDTTTGNTPDRAPAVVAPASNPIKNERNAINSNTTQMTHQVYPDHPLSSG